MIDIPGLKDLEQAIRLEENQSFVGMYDPTKEVSMSENEQGWVRYKFRFLNSEKRIVSMSGGVRLYDGIVAVCGTSDTPRFLRITARGKAGTPERKFDVVEVKGF